MAPHHLHTRHLAMWVVRFRQRMEFRHVLEMWGRSTMNSPWAELVVDEPEYVHTHEFGSCSRQLDLTTPQLRKLVFYQGVVRKCECGAVEIDKGNGTVIYSRNGNRM